MLELLTGTGLAASAGLNAYIPLLALGLLARFTDLVKLPAGWEWLTEWWVLAILAVLLVVEFFADKIPVVDSINDTLQTAVRPTAGGLAFGAGASAETVTVGEPSGFFTDHPWIPVVAGIIIALTVHLVKALVRPVINAFTGGFGAPVASVAEDTASVTMSVVALLIPVLVVLFLIGLILVFWWLLRRRAQRRARRRDRGAAGSYHPAG